MKKLVVMATLLTACNACGAPQAKPLETELAKKIEKAEPVTPTESAASAETEAPKVMFDHSAYDALLKANVNMESGRVDYKGLLASRATLDAYTKSIAEVDFNAFGSDAKFAILVNAYNAYTLTLILDNYGKIKSIRDLKDPWGSKNYVVGGETVSLDNIEHNLLRPIFKDPRIHFAVNCASIGCPPLADFAFTADKLQQQLDTVTFGALKNPRYAKVEGDTLVLTSIMKWYGEDFSKEGWAPRAESVAEFAGIYGSEDVKALVAKKGGKTTVSFGDYDWNLNDIE